MYIQKESLTNKRFLENPSSISLFSGFSMNRIFVSVLNCMYYLSFKTIKKKIIVSSLFDWKIAEVLLSRWGFLIFLDSGILKKKVFTDKSPPCFSVLNFKWMYVFHNQSFRKKKVEHMNISLTTGEQTGKRTSLNIWSEKMNAIISFNISILINQHINWTHQTA